MLEAVFSRRRVLYTGLVLIVALVAGCAAKTESTRATRRDKTVKGGAAGAAAGAVGAVLTGKREADEILAGAAIGAAVGAGVGAYMDRQEERFGKIPGTTVERVDEQTLLVHFDSDILFDVNSSVPSDTAKTTLTDVSGVITEYDKTAVIIQGHTDATGTEEYNQSLSERRADAVRGYLSSRGIDPDRMAAMGFGEGDPVASNDTEEGRRRNRRVDILLRAKAR